MMATAKATPSVILSDAIASLSKTVNSAFAAAENEARAETARAIAEMREIRKERDATMKALNESRLEEHAWKQEVGTWKATAEKAEMTNEHQNETISQLRQEARQWKDQCLRLEETSRREALDWKEQFLRVEQERRNLAARVDELLAEKLAVSNQAAINASLFTPNLKYTEIPDPATSSTATKRASTNPFQSNGYKSAPTSSASDQESPTTAFQNTNRNLHKPKPSKLRRETELDQSMHIIQRAQTLKGSTSKAPRYDGARSQGPISPTRVARQDMRSEPRHQVIRRVTATIDVPVKEEEIDEGEYSQSASASASAQVSSSADVSPTTEIAQTRKANTPYQVPRRRNKRTVVEDDDSYGEDKTDAGNRGNSHESSSEEDDDELMMGAEDNRKEVYGTQRVGATPNRPNGNSTAPKSGGSSGKKRKQAESRVSGNATKARRL